MIAANRTLRNNPGIIEAVIHRLVLPGWYSQNNLNYYNIIIKYYNIIIRTGIIFLILCFVF